MISTEQAKTFIHNWTQILCRALTSGIESDHSAARAAEAEIIALLTGSSRIERDPAADSETKLVEAINPERSRLINQGFQNLFDELVLRQQRMHEVLAGYVGCEPDRLVLRARDLLHMTVDLGVFMNAMGGPWAEVVKKIEADEVERKKRTKFATRSMEDEAKPILVKKQAAPETETTPEAAKG